jgi:hypothetical protein
MHRTLMIPMLLASAALIGRASEPPFAVSAPAALIDLDLGKLKGAPTCLAWSTNEGEFYLQTVDGATMRHYILRLGSSPEAADGEPIWASTYWTWKSARTVPGHSELVIEVATRNDTNQITSMNLHDKAAGTGDRSGTGAPRDMMNANIGAAQVRTLLLDGEVIGEFVNAPLVPGLTFGWSPEALHAVAYVPHSHRLTLMDVISGAKLEVSATSDVVLPAWSPDGSQIVFLQKTGRKTFALMRVTVTRP